MLFALHALFALCLSAVSAANTRAPRFVRAAATFRIGLSLPPIRVGGTLLDQPFRAVQLAVDEMNAAALLPGGVRMELFANETTTDWDTLTATLFHVNEAKVTAIIGAVDAASAKLTSFVTQNRSVSIVSPSGLEYEQRLAKLYPGFFRVSPSDVDAARVVQYLLEHFGWSRVGVIHSGDDVGLKGIKAALSLTPNTEITIVGSVHLTEPHDRDLTDRERAEIRRLGAEGVKIFVLSVRGTETNAVLEFAHKEGLLAQSQAWIVVNCNYGTDMFDPITMNGIICVRHELSQSDELKNLESKLQSYKGKEKSLWLNSIYAYDAANAIGQAARDVMAEGGPKLPLASLRSLLLRRLSSLNFTGVTGSFQLNNAARRGVYEVVNYREGKMVPFGTWDVDRIVFKEHELSMMRWPGNGTATPVDVSTAGKSKIVVQALVPISWPFTDFVDSATGESCVSRRDHTGCHFTGVAVKTIEKVAESPRINFDLNYTLWTESWLDAVKIAGNLSSPYDMVVGSVTITSERAQYATFSRDYYDTGLRMLVRRPRNAKASYFEFFEPFERMVWLVFLLSLLSAAPVLYYLDPKGVDSQSLRGHPNPSRKNIKLHQISDATNVALTHLFAVHRAENFKKWLGRIYSAVLSFTCLVMIGAYTANMAAFLTQRQNSDKFISTYKELVGSRVGCRYGTSNWDYVENELNLAQNLVPVLDAQDAQDKLRKGDIVAYIADSPHVIGIAAKDCDFIVVGSTVQDQRYGFPMRKNFPYISAINRELSHLLDTEFMVKTLEETLNSSCSTTVRQNDRKSIGIEDVKGLFVLTSGVALVALIYKGSWIIHVRIGRKRGKRQNKVDASGSLYGKRYRKLSDGEFGNGKPKGAFDDDSSERNERSDLREKE